MLNIITNASSSRSRPMAWMREPVWKWHIVHTDYMQDTMPRYNALSGRTSPNSYIAIGFDQLDNEHNGPNANEVRSNDNN